MNHLLEDDEDLRQRRDREVTLSTGAILGIFFALVLVCGGFFAFGYNLGQKSTATTVGADTANTNNGSAANFSSFKPSAGSPLNSASSAKPTSTTAPLPPPAATTQPAPAEDTTSTPAPQPTSASTPVATRPAPAQPVAVTPAYANAPGSFVVQIAAVSHQEDATLLVGALRGKGYTVSAHTEPQDHLIHIQVGPFNNRKDADTMRQRLLGDGYNAIVK